MSSKPPILLADGYVNVGADAPLRVFNVIASLTQVQVKSHAFESADPYSLTIVDDPSSATGKSAIGAVPVSGEIEPGEFEASILFPEWGAEFKNQRVRVDSSTALDPLYAELIPGEEHDGKRMYNLRVSPVSPNLSTALAATDIPGNSLEDWFGLSGDAKTGMLHQNLVTPLPIQAGTYTVKVRQRFYDHSDETGVEKQATVVLHVDDDDTKPGGQPFIVTRLLDPNKMGTKPFIKHSIPFGDDHEQPNTRYGVSTELVVTNPGGGEPDLPADIVEALGKLRPITINRQADRIILTTGNPPILRQNHNFKIKFVVTVTPLKEEATPAVSTEPEDAPHEAADAVEGPETVPAGKGSS